MDDVNTDQIELDQVQDESLAYDLSDDALEAAAGSSHAPSTAWMGTRYGCCPS